MRPRTLPLRLIVLLALFVLGQVAALRLIDVFPYAVFQHFVPWGRALDERWLALGLVVAQSLVCLVAAGTSGLLAIARGLLRLLGVWRLAIVLGILGLCLAVPTESVSRFAGEVVMAAWLGSIALLNLALAAGSMPASMLGRIREWVDTRVTLDTNGGALRPWDRRLPWIAAAWVGIVCSALAWFVFDGVPHIDDSVTYLFQAKTLALGRLSVPPAPDTMSFAVEHLIDDGRQWYSKFFPGWPVVLAVGAFARVPWLVNPLLGAIAILLAHNLIRRVFERGTANGAVLLLAASPWLLFTSSDMMSEAAALVWGLLALLAIDLQRARRTGIWSVVAGVSLGALFLTRPLEAALLGPVAALWAWGVAGRRLPVPALALIAAVAAGMASLMLVYNAALTGDALAAPHRLWAEAFWGPGVDVFGFGANIGIPEWRNVDPLPGHGIADVILNTNKNLYLMGFELFGWATGSLVLAAIAVWLVPSRGSDLLMLAISAAIIGGHAFYWAPGGPDFGARYWYLVIVPLCVMSVRAAQALAARLNAAGASGGEPGARVGSAIAVASLAALLLVMPWRSVTKYHRYRGIGADVRELSRTNPFGGSLVFVRSIDRADYQAAFNFNSPLLDGPGPVLALDTGPERRAAIVRRYPRRPVWVIGRTQEESVGLVVLEGPLPPGTNPSGADYKFPHALQANLR